MRTLIITLVAFSAIAVASCGGGPHGSGGPVPSLDSGLLSGRLAAAGTAHIIDHVLPLAPGGYAPDAVAGLAAAPNGDIAFSVYAMNASNAQRYFIGSLHSGIFSAYTYVPRTNPSAGAPKVAYDGNGSLWFADESTFSVGRIQSPGKYVEYHLPSLPDTYLNARALGTGADGTIWLSAYYSPSSGSYKPFFAHVFLNGQAKLYTGMAGAGQSMTVGPDGDIWFNADPNILRITNSGVVSQVARVGYVYGLTNGPDHAAWAVRNPSVVTRVPLYGSLRSYALPGTPNTSGIMEGSDKNLWVYVFLPADPMNPYGNFSIYGFDRVTPTGARTYVPLDPSNLWSPWTAIADRHGNLWFMWTELSGTRIHLSEYVI